MRQLVKVEEFVSICPVLVSAMFGGETARVSGVQASENVYDETRTAV